MASRVRRHLALSIGLQLSWMTAGCSMDLMTFFRYTMDARRAISHAREAVDVIGGTEIAPEHLVLGILESDVRASRLLQVESIEPDDLRERLRSLHGARPRADAIDVPLTADARRILDTAQEEAKRRGAKVTSEDILVGVLLVDTAAGRLLLARGLRVDEVREAAGVERP